MLLCEHEVSSRQHARPPLRWLKNCSSTSSWSTKAQQSFKNVARWCCRHSQERPVPCMCTVGQHQAAPGPQQSNANAGPALYAHEHRDAALPCHVAQPCVARDSRCHLPPVPLRHIRRRSRGRSARSFLDRCTCNRQFQSVLRLHRVLSRAIVLARKSAAQVPATHRSQLEAQPSQPVLLERRRTTVDVELCPTSATTRLRATRPLRCKRWPGS